MSTIDNLFTQQNGSEVIKKEGFVDTKIVFGESLKIYKTQTKGLLYDPKTDEIILKYDLNHGNKLL